MKKKKKTIVYRLPAEAEEAEKARILLEGVRPPAIAEEAEQVLAAPPPPLPPEAGERQRVEQLRPVEQATEDEEER